jgi:hypothetical protein
VSVICRAALTLIRWQVVGSTDVGDAVFSSAITVTHTRRAENSQRVRLAHTAAWVNDRCCVLNIVLHTTQQFF